MNTFPIIAELLPTFKARLVNIYRSLMILSVSVLLVFFMNNARAQCSGSYPTLTGAYPGVPSQFEWSDNCPAVRNYEVQVLRLFNVDPLKKTPHDITAVVDWGQALSFTTNTGPSYSGGFPYDMSFAVTLAEGTGFYVWRVRRIGGWDWKGSANNMGWSQWSPTGAFLQGATVGVNAGSLPGQYCFFYDQFDDNLNWVFKRKFQEGPGPKDHFFRSRFSEKISYANSLLMPEQEQERSHFIGGTNVSGTVNDYLGRPVLKTLPVYEPGSFGYLPLFTRNSGGQPYSPVDFDLESNYHSPGGLDGNVYQYYDLTNSDPGLSNTQGKGYSRIMYYNDGTERPREIAGPGQGLGMGSDHTTKKFYGKPTSTELKDLLGDEAPKAESVLKTYTKDPNGVYNVTYTDEAGRVIITGLTTPASDLLTSLTLGDAKYVSDTLRDKIQLSPTRLLSKATYVFPSPRQLSYVYELLPKTYGDGCNKLCASCDYRVVLTAKERDDTITYRYIQDVVPVFDSVDGYCSGYFSLTKTDNYKTPSTLLPAGTYDINLVLELKRTNPVTGKYYIDEAVEILHRKIDERIYGTGSTGYILPSLVPKSIPTMLDYLDAPDMLGLLNYIGADISKKTFKLTIGCDELTLPTLRCETPECAPPKFAEYMKTEMQRYNSRTGTSFYAPALANTGLGGIAMTTSTDNMFLIESDQEFNDIITRMVNDGYNCTQLYNAWTKTVQNYLGAQRALAPTGTTALNTIMPKFDWWGDFMNRVGYKIALEVKPYSELTTPTSDVRKKPYRYFPYDWGTGTLIEDAFCQMYQGSAPCTTATVPPTAPVWYSNTTSGLMATANNFPGGNPNSKPFHIYHFYKAIKNSGVTALSGTGYGSYPKGNLGSIFNVHYSPSFNGGGHNASVIRQECIKMCDARMDGVVSDLANIFMDNNLKVEGFNYDLAWRPGWTDTIAITQLLCLSKSVVEYCRSGCDVTPDSSGYISFAKFSKIRRSMFYSMELLPSKTTISSCTTGYELAPLVPGSTQEYQLYWINRLKRIQQNTQVQNGTTNVPNWSPFVPPVSLFSAPFNSAPCNTANIPLNYDDYNGIFTLGRPRLYTPSPACSSPIAYYAREHADTIMVNSEFDVKVTVVLNTALAATDTIRIAENMQSPLSFISGPGPNNGTNYSVHWVIGPTVAGDTITFTYKMKAPSSPASPQLQGSVRKYGASGGTIYCDNFNTTVRVVNCVGMYYHRSYGDPPDKLICGNVCYSAATCSGGVCVKWVEQVAIAGGDSMKPLTCESIVCEAFRNELTRQVELLHKKYEARLRRAYDTLCLNPKNIDQTLINTYYIEQGQYTLYYYDRAGNLIRTNQPKGVTVHNVSNPMPVSGNPEYKFATQYDYNTLGQVKRQYTPDGLETKYWYNVRGLLRVTQNEKQKVSSAYSYIRYDDQDRIIETGETQNTFVAADLDGNGWPSTGIEITYTIYDRPYAGFPGTGPLPGGAFQRCLRNRVSYTITDKNLGTLGNERITTVYSYDPHGNVELVYQDIPPMPTRMISYENNIFTGQPYKVSLMNTDSTVNAYDNYSLTFHYDGDSRLKAAGYSLVNSLTPYGAADYEYDLANKNQVRRKRHDFDQGVDYTYTLQGWLKGINHTNEADDPGQDGAGNDVSKDAYAEVLHYFDGDFQHSGSPFDDNAPNINNESAHNVNPYTTPYRGFLNMGLYNGNISAIQEFVRPVIGTSPGDIDKFYQKIVGHTYRYDQLNRITASYFHELKGGVWWRDANEPPNPTPYDESFEYDKNGNFIRSARTVQVNGPGAPYTASMDNSIGQGFYYQPNTNILDSIADANGINPPTPVLPKYWGIRHANKYRYDEIGNLAKDKLNDLHISWLPNGKLDAIVRPVGGVIFFYDAMGNRVKKLDGVTGLTTYYIYDAGNNLLATYSGANGASGAIGTGISVLERYLYGSERIGAIHGPNIVGPGAGFGMAEFEITDHLGNVRSLVEHRRGQQGHAEPVVNAFFNYYAFGAPHPDRVYNGLNSRFGFNGQEKDDNFMGQGKLSNFGARMYDPTVGRFWARDPQAAKMPGWSPYSYCFNDPILFVDPDGEYPVVRITKQKAGSALQRIIGYVGSSKEQYTKVDLYKVLVTDTEDRNFKMSFTVTRDAFAVRPGDSKNGRMTLTNVAFEPKDGNINHYTAKPMVYPKKDGTKALKLTQYGSEEMYAEPNEASVELGYRKRKSDVAAGVMIHVGGVYQHADGTTSCAASEGCFGVTDGNSSSENPSNEYSDDVLGSIIDKANKSKTNKGKIEVIIEKRESSERPTTKTENQK